MLTKAKLREQMNNLPDEFSIDELIERLILIEKIEQGDRQSKNEEILTETDLDDEMEQWFK